MLIDTQAFAYICMDHCARCTSIDFSSSELTYVAIFDPTTMESAAFYCIHTLHSLICAMHSIFFCACRMRTRLTGININMAGCCTYCQPTADFSHTPKQHCQNCLAIPIQEDTTCKLQSSSTHWANFGDGVEWLKSTKHTLVMLPSVVHTRLMQVTDQDAASVNTPETFLGLWQQCHFACITTFTLHILPLQ